MTVVEIEEEPSGIPRLGEYVMIRRLPGVITV